MLISAFALAVFVLTLGHAVRTTRSCAHVGEPFSLARRLAHQGVLAALVAFLQASASYWPGIGRLLAALGSLPVALGCLLAPGGAFFMLLLPAGLLLALSAREALIFLFTTAPTGLLAGWAASAETEAWLRWSLPGVGLGAGLFLMARTAGVPALGPAVEHFGALPAVEHFGALPAALFYFGFGFVYSTAWAWLIRRFGRRWLGVLLERSIRA